MSSTFVSEELHAPVTGTRKAMLSEVPGVTPESLISLLEEIRQFGGQARTTGLSDATVSKFAERDPKLVIAIQRAHQIFQRLQQASNDSTNAFAAAMITL